MTRLDLFLFEKGFAGSRTEARRLIEAGLVSVNGSFSVKPSTEVDDSVVITVAEADKKYVSRGGLKLEGALDSFRIDPSGRRCLDVGASSGGFTDCLLQRGALAVVAVDSGIGQLSPSLRLDERVICYEKFNARYMTPTDLPFSPSLAVIDVSFISLTLILPSLYNVLDNGGELICLIKPQFEVGRSGVGKGGIVKSESLRKGAIDKVVCCAESLGFSSHGVIRSPIEGGDGNIEFLAYFKKD